MIILRNKNFSESKGDNKSKKDKAINAGLVYGSLGSAGYGLSALNSTSKKSRIKLRQRLRDGYKSGSLNTLHKNIGKTVLSDEPRLIKEEMVKYGKEQLKKIPKRAADFAKKTEKTITRKNKRAGKIALGISAGLLGARAIRGISEYKKKKDDDNTKK